MASWAHGSEILHFRSILESFPCKDYNTGNIEERRRKRDDGFTQWKATNREKGESLALKVPLIWTMVEIHFH